MSGTRAGMQAATVWQAMAGRCRQPAPRTSIAVPSLHGVPRQPHAPRTNLLAAQPSLPFALLASTGAMLHPCSNRVRTTAASVSLGCTANSGFRGCTRSATSSSRSALQKPEQQQRNGQSSSQRHKSGQPAALLLLPAPPRGCCRLCCAIYASDNSHSSQKTTTLAPPAGSAARGQRAAGAHRIVCRSISCSLMGLALELTTERRRCSMWMKSEADSMPHTRPCSPSHSGALAMPAGGAAAAAAAAGRHQ